VSAYRDQVANALAEGARFAALYAAEHGQVVRAVFVDPDGSTRIESVNPVDGAVPTVVDVVPAAGWDEREAHDLYGIGFAGHEPLRPLVDHDQPLERWTVPVRGRDTYQVAVGPIHAGVIESGHFRFHVVGDRILHLDGRLFYKHRGLQTAAEGVELVDGMPFVSRACAACSATNAIAYADACEQILGLHPTAELSRVRTALLELERVWNHLNDIAAICAGVGLAAGNNAFAALTERARRLNQSLTGHRFLRGAVRVGGSDLRWDTETIRTAVDELAKLRIDAARAWRELDFNASLQDRLTGVGVIDAAQADRLGVVGPAARAAGVAEDARTHSTALTYPGFAPVLPEQPDGDVRARYEQRGLELWQSFTLLDKLLDGPVDPSRAEPYAPSTTPGIGVVEGPRGRTTCVVEPDADRIGRLHLRTASYANWPAVATAAQGNLLPDFPLINKSFELCYACADR
jgi:Ni,Fe-hydrogenase III large subunit